ncbi:MAG: hypothetical protein ACR2MC_02375 [Actinomycetota bacterium]
MQAAVLSDQIQALLKTCEGKIFEQRRDHAILRLYSTPGWVEQSSPPSACQTWTSIKASSSYSARVRRPRSCPYGRKTVVALDRYLRERARHSYAFLDALWLGRRAAMSNSGISQIVDKRGLQAGIDGLHLHQLRNTFALGWLTQGGNEILMRFAGVALPSQGGAQATQAWRSLLRRFHRRGPLWR